MNTDWLEIRVTNGGWLVLIKEPPYGVPVEQWVFTDRQKLLEFLAHNIPFEESLATQEQKK